LLPRLRTALLYLLTVLLTGAAVESISFAGLWWALGGRPDLDGITAAQELLASGEGEENLDRRIPAATGAGYDSYPHPYVGYMMHEMPEVEEETYHLSGSAIYDPAAPVYRQDPDQLIIAITGGSVARNFLVEGSSRLSSILRQSDLLAGKRIVYVGMAMGALKQPQQVASLAYYLALGGRLDVLINLDGFNEIALHPVTNAEKGVFYLYPHHWFIRSYLIRATGVARDYGDLLAAREARREAARRALDSRWRWLYGYQFLWAMRDRALRTEMQDARARLEAFEPDEEDVAAVGPRRDLGDSEQMVGELALLWQRCSEILQGMAFGMGFHYLHFLQPNQYVQGSKVLSEEERSIAFREDHVYREPVIRGYPALRRLGRELIDHGVDFHDLTDVFSPYSETIYSDDCCHVNARGSEILAEVVAQAVLEKLRRAPLG
jgi:hypothetical protein